MVVPLASLQASRGTFKKANMPCGCAKSTLWLGLQKGILQTATRRFAQEMLDFDPPRGTRSSALTFRSLLQLAHVCSESYVPWRWSVLALAVLVPGSMFGHGLISNMNREMKCIHDMYNIYIYIH